MKQAMPLTRFYQLSPQRRRMFLRAAFALTTASVAVALLPFRRAIEFGSVSLKRRAGVIPEDCVWAVEALARRLPWRTMCIQKGLAVQRLLRREGVDAALHYGACLSAEEEKLEAHVWISVDGVTIVGGEEAPRFVEIATYP